jgi:beta-glucosidase/6-phospho-beta-glucosidase/beta-galactosidase
MTSTSLFASFFQAGFECSTHVLRDGKRLDLIAATGHDQHAAADYRRLREVGIRTAREGVRWHLAEPAPGQYDFSSALPMIRAARDAGVQVVWDLCHYGWPADLDPFRPEFAERLAGLARAFARLLADETDAVPWITPVNEISFLAHEGGEVGELNPFAVGRGDELKARLVQAAIAAIDAFWEVQPRARVCLIDPLFATVAHPDRPYERADAEAYNQAKYQGWDMLCGRLRPELGGHPRYLDVIGVNYYPWNQWFHPSGPEIPREHALHRPLRELLRELYDRYRRPLFVAETSCEGARRPDWLRYIYGEVLAARQEQVPVEGICWYPIVDYPGWDNDRHCLCGLWGYADNHGQRECFEPLAQELRRQQLE